MAGSETEPRQYTPRVFSDMRVHSPNPTVGPTQAKKMFDKVLKASRTGGKGTHVRALMNPKSPGFDSKFKDAWDKLSKPERNEVLRKQDQQIATKQSVAKMGKTEKKQVQLTKRAEKKFKAMDTDGSGDISIDELRTAMMSEEVFGSFSAGPANEADVKRRFADMDVNSDGKISLTEFQDQIARESKKRQEDFWGTYAENGTTVMDLAKVYGTFTKRSTQKQDGPIQIVFPETQKQDGPIQIVFEDSGPDVVADALAKLSSLSAAASDKLGPDAKSSSAPDGPNELTDFIEKALDDLRQSLSNPEEK